MNAAFTVFSPQQWKVLQALGQYRFLTVDQMLRLGISKNAKSLRDKTLFALRHHKCIYSVRINPFLPDVHYLTSKGRNLLAVIEERELEPHPAKKRQPLSALFAKHRFAQVDFHIGMQQWADARGDAELLLELQDFVTTTASGSPAPSTELHLPELVNSIIPDGTFAVGLTSGPVAVYLVEIHRATQSKAVTDQLAKYFEVIKGGAIAQQHGFKAHPIICSVHHQPSVMASVKRRLTNHTGFAPFKRNFVFHRLDNLSENFTATWHFADDTPADPFPMPSPKNDAS